MRFRFIFFFCIIAVHINGADVVIPTLHQLSLDEKIGQCMMMATVSDESLNGFFMLRSPYTLNHAYAQRMIEQYHVGGIIFLGAGTPDAQIQITKKLQSLSQYPLLIGLDAEWGLSMRHRKDVVSFPRAMTLGALADQDDALIFELGKEVGKQCAQIGVHINFAPVADVNNNARNPIINTRSFGEDPQKVAKKAELYMRGMQESGILTCAKHFPGHGDTTIDTHHGRAAIMHDYDRLKALELLPFEHLIQHNVDAIMTAHLDVPALSRDEMIPATVSFDIITTLLREALHFDGLVITDGLGMRGITDMYAPGELELKVLQAGADILLCPVDIPAAVARIKKAIHEKEFSEAALNERVERILAAKRRVIKTVYDDQPLLITPEAQALKQQLYQAAVTVVCDDQNMIPIPSDKKLLVRSFGNADHCIDLLRKHYIIQPIDDTYAVQPNDAIIMTVHADYLSGMIEMQKQKGTWVPDEVRTWMNTYADQITLLLFGNPYSLEGVTGVRTIIVGYENVPESVHAVVEVLRSSQKARGVLPVTPPK